MSEENAIVITNLTKKFSIYHEKINSIFEFLVSLHKKNKETLTVLDNISCSFKKGQMIGLLGRNGSGKTTLFRLISKIYEPTSGKIVVNGSILPLLEVGTGFQPDLTARANIILYGLILGFSKKEIIKKIPEIINFAELENFIDTRIKNFSSGMIARLAFSTAIQVDPDILLVDEILSVGDFSFQKKSINKMMEFKKRGKTIVFVSHSIEQIKNLCDYAIFLKEGKIHSEGKPDEVVKEYLKYLEN